MCRCKGTENSGGSPVKAKSVFRAMMMMKKGGSKRVLSPTFFFWVCLLMAVFTILVYPTLDPFNRIYKANRLHMLTRPGDVCSGKRVFMYDLPPQFNVDLSNRSKCDGGLIFWMDLCPRFGNGGYGLKLWDEGGVGEFDLRSWYDTDSYMLEVIFHNRMKEYACLTEVAAAADAIFIPYYTGLDALVHLYPRRQEHNHTQLQQEQQQQQEARRLFGMELIRWLEEHGGDTWRRFGGSDHFLIMGRTTWDFKFKQQWGTGFSTLPYVDNMTRLLIETEPLHDNEFAIPYPTSFHPSSPKRLARWIDGVKKARRPFLFSYVGAPRPDIWSVRGVLSSQCAAAGDAVCRLVNCSVVKCSHDPESIYRAFLQSQFCLQPRGDSTTRRSTFDCLIAGAIPVFFHNDSAYTQYEWHLPRDHESYSVFISEEELTAKPGPGVSIQEVLGRYSPARIRAMRETIVSILPSLVYNGFASDPWGSGRDAFDVSVAGVLERIAARKKNFTRAQPVQQALSWRGAMD